MPVTEPITVAQCKARLGVRSAHRDAEIGQLITAARLHIEAYCNVALVEEERTFTVRAFGSAVPIPCFPVKAPVVIAYTDNAGVSRTFNTGRLVTADRPAIVMAPATGWPGDATFPATATLDCGDWSGTPGGEVPGDLIQAMLLLVGHWFEHHEAVTVGKVGVELPLGVKALCRRYRLKF